MCNQQSLRSVCAYMRSLIRALASHSIFNEYKVTDRTSFGISKLSRRLHRLVRVSSCQYATLLEITCNSSYLIDFRLSRDMRFPTMWYVQPAKPQISLRIYAQSDQSPCLSLEYSMNIKLLTEHLLEFLSFQGDCTGLSESIHVKMPHCWKSHVTAQII